jgi:hypothetical protein
MLQAFPRQSFVGLGVLAFSLWATALSAQPPGPGKGRGPKRPPGPPPNAEFKTVRGTVKEFTTAPRGEVDGLLLSDGTWVHWPPHMQDRFTAIVSRGDRVEATGYWETGPAGDTKLEVSTLTNLATNRTSENPDRPSPARIGPRGRPGPRGRETATVRGTVKEFTTAPKGEVDGLRLSDGTWVHWPPHLQDRFTAIVARGDRVQATGSWENGPADDTKLEISRLTNLTSGKTSDNPDRPQPGPPGLGRGPGRAGDIEERLQALEERVDRLTAQVERLLRKK